MNNKYTKFNPNDEATFPKAGTPVLCVVWDDKIAEYGIYSGYASKDFARLWAAYANGGCSIFWTTIEFPDPKKGGGND